MGSNDVRSRATFLCHLIFSTSSAPVTVIAKGKIDGMAKNVAMNAVASHRLPLAWTAHIQYEQHKSAYLAHSKWNGMPIQVIKGARTSLLLVQ